MIRLAFVTNICPHYRVRTFETLAEQFDVDYYFFSAGNDWYWPAEHGARAGEFRFRYLPGFQIAGTRFTPTLPLMLSRGGYDAYVKCINGRFALPMTYLVARLTGRPFVLWTGVWMRLDTPVHRLLFPITRYLYRHADAIVAYGDHVKRFLESEGVPAQRIFIAPHAIDNSAYSRLVGQQEIAAVRGTLGIDASAQVVLFIGRLETEKGLPDLLKAFASISRATAVLVLAGTGSQLAELQETARVLGISDRVRFPGYVDPDGTTALYATADVFVLPSVTTDRFKEPWGLVVNEAFNQGVPVIATESVGAAAGGLVADGVNGNIVPERNSRSLAAALQRILDDRELRATMSRNARSAIAQWDNDRMVSGFKQALDYVLARRGAPLR